MQSIDFWECVQPTSTIRGGAGDGEGTSSKKGKGLGAMPRISHMVVTNNDDVNDDLLAYLQQAHDHVHK